jgi:hypothetical protein
VKAEDFSVTPGTVVYHKAADEPLLVITNNEVVVTVRRYVQSAKGSFYTEEQFGLNEVETAHARALREADFMKFLFELRSDNKAVANVN